MPDNKFAVSDNDILSDSWWNTLEKEEDDILEQMAIEAMVDEWLDRMDAVHDLVREIA